jgi:hypothetical protein
MRTFVFAVIIIFGVLGLESARSQQGKTDSVEKRIPDVVSFRQDIFPIVKKNCLPCHAEDNFNPSELTLDSYDKMMSGGKHGAPVVPGNSSESILIGKLSSKPPFGDRMPLDPRKKHGGTSARRLTDEEIKIISDWIDRGAKND